MNYLASSRARKYLKWTTIIVSVALLLIALAFAQHGREMFKTGFNFAAKLPMTQLGKGNNIWANSPRFSLCIRLYYDSIPEYWQMFAPSYLAFWPITKWRNSDVVLVFDDESADDHKASTLFSIIPPYPKIVFEKAPPPGTLCSRWRREGYSRQIYSNFYGDMYSDADYIGITDTDTFFSTKIVIEDLFDKATGKPRILGYNGCCTGWEKSASSIVDGKRIGEFMIVLGFPFIVKRQHFKLFREHVMNVLNKTTFEESFSHICNTYEQYTQYDLLGFYLFVYHRDEYSWHLRDNEHANHPAMKNGKMSTDPEILKFSSPKIGVMRHCGHINLGDVPLYIYDYICTAANFSDKVGSCSGEPIELCGEIQQSVEANLLTDWTAPTARANERGLREDTGTFHPVSEKMPENSQQLLDERAAILQLYNGSWSW